MRAEKFCQMATETGQRETPFCIDKPMPTQYSKNIIVIMKNTNFTVYIDQDEDGIFVGSIPSVPSCYAEGKTQKEMLKNLQQVLRLCLRNADVKSMSKTRFVGIQNVEIYA